MTDRDRWGLRGAVRHCRIQRTWNVRRCDTDACDTTESGDATIIEFRLDGALVSEKHRNPDGSEWTSLHEHNEAGRVVYVRTESQAGPGHSRVYEYDSNGRLVSVIARSENERDRLVERHDYDAAGQRTRTLHTDLSTQSECVLSWAVEGSDSAYSAPGTATLITRYNTREQPTEMAFQDAAGRLLSRVEFAYDEAGCLVMEAQTRMADSLPTEMTANLNEAVADAVRALIAAGTVQRHVYDARGRRIETQSSTAGSLARDRKTTTYNDRNDPIAEVSEHEDREYSIDDEGRIAENPESRQRVSRSEARINYAYDAFGNWIEKIVEGRAGADQDFAVSAIERRSLTYFGG